METRRLGGSDVEVCRVALGCGNFGGIGSAPEHFGGGESREEAFAIMDDAWARGIRSFDTGDAYGGGRSETWIGEWISGRGRRPTLTTKVFHSATGDPEDRGLAPERVRRQIRSSLARLGVERVDLYLTHEPDPQVPLRDTLATFAALAEGGLVRAFGLSNVTAAEVEDALAMAPVALVQNSYSLLDREAEAELLPLCAERGVAFQAFSPLAGGWLAGRYRRGEPAPPGSRMTLRPGRRYRLDDDALFDGLEALEREAAAHGVGSATLALAWLLSDDRVASVVVGPRRPAHLDPALEALGLRLSPAERDALAALVPGSR